MPYIDNDNKAIRQLCIKQLLCFIVYDLFRGEISDNDFANKILKISELSVKDIQIYSLDSNINKFTKKQILDNEMNKYKDIEKYSDTAEILKEYNKAILYLAEKIDGIANVTISDKAFLESLKAIGKHNIQALYWKKEHKTNTMQKPIIGRLATMIIQDGGFWGR
ncbi:hypothetical protein DCO58_07475 [Helicobacter saguini]|uniref:Uncharacterized protein n=1 Tax=Helicobacter saguini TaxID=1548018 RepID=A0A347VNB9_9HELI|nr:hypothetical protein [Helicobacter saguini]MWV61826.1 hypothetical protein [Helicobacter saguini]MWV67499.1 hypothetical protein [Helicobacter saguini]MWV69850.1 hypothetical protein [Helicobacter saguini]MWV72932.1 hypothetical protein [Helicobacter saguini]TLD95684.1 hypothetical protein LS64_002195 [Helicobacter saguini]